MKAILRVFIIFTFLPFTLDVQAQVSTTAISGKVTDPGGMPLSGAKVVATHIPSGSLFAAITNQSGSFRLPDLGIGGPYSVKITVNGFKPFAQNDIYLVLGSDYVINASLKAKELAISKRHKARDTVLVVLSMDGFRWDYPQLYHTPNLDRMAKKGVKAVSLMPSYPTKTFPNHYTLATGLYPDHHGIVQNSFYDPNLDRTFRMGDREAVQDSIFWEGDAIWETAAKQGIRCATYFWVGSESDEHFRPAYSKYYQSGFPYLQQVDTIIQWLSLPSDSRPGLVMFYFDEPDKNSHDYGPVGDSTRRVVERLDHTIGQIIRGFRKVEKRQGILINFIVLSDHGMGNIPEGNQVFLDNIIDLKRIKRINGGNPVITLEPEAGYSDEAYRLLKTSPHIKVWRKDELPDHYHYGTHLRIPELIVEADSAWGLEIRKREGVLYTRGTHGYDPKNRDMHGIFYAMGPSFKKGHLQPTFENVAIYELMAKILKIRPSKNDGDFSTISGVLKGN